MEREPPHKMSGKRGNKRSNGEKIQTLGMYMSPQMGRPGTFFFVAIHGFVICGKLISAMGARLHHRVHLMLTIIWERPECTRGGASKDNSDSPALSIFLSLALSLSVSILRPYMFNLTSSRNAHTFTASFNFNCCLPLPSPF